MTGPLAQRESGSIAGGAGVENRGPPDPASAAYDAPASFGQHQLWVIDRLLPERVAYNESWVERVRGPLDRAALERAFDEIVRRHDVLRTRFVTLDGELRQVVVPPGGGVLAFEDLSAQPPGEGERRARAIAQDDASRPFDLGRGPLLRLRLLRLAPDEHWLALAVHHIVFDRWSAAVLSSELAALYDAFHRGAPSPLPEPALQFADFAEWQARRLDAAALERLSAYWGRALEGLATLALPADRVRPAVASFRGAEVAFEVDAALTGALRELARRHDATLFMVLLAAIQVLLHRWTGDEDVPVGVPVAGRDHPELEAMIGLFANVVVMRGDLARDPDFAGLLARTRRVALDAYAHAELPFEKVVERLAPRRDLARNPLYQVAFRMGNTPPLGLRLPGLAVERVAPAGRATSKFDLSIGIAEREGRLAVRIEHATDLFETATIERLADCLRVLLGAIVANPHCPISRLPLLEPAERARLVEAGRRAPTPFPDAAPVDGLFEAAADRDPAAIAVVEGDAQLAYRELDERANRLAHLLRRSVAQPQPQPRIALALERGADLVVAMLAVLKAGGAYVPVDPEWPLERIAFVVRDAGVGLVVTAEALVARLPAQGVAVVCVDRDAAAIAAQPATRPARDGAAPGLAYVMYTSGSTGEPKGVAIPHRAIARLVCATDYLQLGPDDVVAHAANPAFDAATFEIWGALVNGARIVVIPRMVALAPRALAGVLEASGATALFLTTSLFNEVARSAPDAFRRCRTVLFGGEAVEPRWVRAVLEAAPPARLLHVYGPTEVTTFATWHEVREAAADAATIPIGTPIANTEAMVLDAALEPVPPGFPGELVLSGPGLADGYLGRPDLTAERFVAHPFDPRPGARVFRTGDVVRARRDGAIEFVGRRDRQVKLRGHRIELDEVEAAIARLPQVRECAVVLRGEAAATRQLVAYAVAADADGPPPAHLRRELKRILPESMLPSAVVWLRALPTTPGGKVDRRALPGLPAAGAAGGEARVPPRDMLEEVLVRIWERLLGVEEVGVFDHFFEIGGHSLLAARLVDAIERETGIAVPLAALFADDTIAGFGARLRAGFADFGAPIVVLHGEGSGTPVVFQHGDLNGGGFYARAFARELGSDHPLCVVRPHMLSEGPVPETIEAMAADRVRALRALRPHGPYVCGGYCNGGQVAFEMARQLCAAGERVPLVFVVETRAPQDPAAPDAGPHSAFVVVDPARGYRVLGARDWNSDTQLRYVTAMDRYAGGAFAGRVVVVHSRTLDRARTQAGWSRVAAEVEMHELPGDHTGLVTRHVDTLARIVLDAMRRAGA